MNTRLPALALALATLGTACDSETSPSSDAWEFREEIVPPTTTTGTSFTVKGGHDNPFEILLMDYNIVPLEYQIAFHDEALLQARLALETEFLANERNLAACPWICEELDASWNEGAYITTLEVEYDEVLTDTDRAGQLHWTTEASASAEIGCGCV